VLTTASPRHLFWIAAAVLAAFRFWLGFALPITGDEAYFVVWGRNPAWGFYDHPPMVGWWLTALLAVSEHVGWLRMPSILLPYLAALLAFRWIARALPDDPNRPWWGALLVLLAPAYVWNVLVTTDTPMIVFALLSAAAYLRGLDATGGRRNVWMAAAGLFLSLALLSKYFSVFLAFAFAAHIVAVRRDRRRWNDLALLVVCSLPGPLLNVWWNSTHCWNNVMFNVFNRNEKGDPAWKSVPGYLATVLYLCGPYAAWVLWKARRTIDWKASPLASAGFLAALPLGLFGVVSIGKVVGLHWPLAFVSLALTWLAAAAPAAAMPRWATWSAVIAALHAALFIAVLALPASTWRDTKYYESFVLARYPDQVLAPLAGLGSDWILANDGYSNASTLSFQKGRPFIVFGPGASHARQDDEDTDWRALDGRNIAIYRKTEFTRDEFDPYFERVEYQVQDVQGVTFTLVRGYGFRYAAYREGVLRGVRERWYRLPAWLPNRGCYIGDRYFPDEPAPVRR
jgi:hypothetical protein